MKFFIEHPSLNRSRIGRLLFKQVNIEKQEELITPMCLLYTKAGNVPHLTHDVLQKVTGQEKTATIIPLPSIIDFRDSMKQFGSDIGKFIGLDDRALYISIEDPAVQSQTGFNNKGGVGVFCHGGKIQLDIKEFMDLQEIYKPAWFQCLSDSDTPKNCSNKRINHSINRTLSYLDKCLEIRSQSEVLKDIAVFGSLQGGYQLKPRVFSAKETALRPVDGFVLEGFHTNGPDVAKLNYNDAKDLINKVVQLLPDDKPRLMHGPFNPSFILNAIESGVDIFDASYPFMVTELKSALRFSFDIDAGSNENEGAFYFSLEKEEFKEDMTPILTNCKCYTCQNFTKAYINHLLVTSEMLGHVLLMVHNLSHYLSFFQCIREALKNDKLDLLKNIVKRYE